MESWWGEKWPGCEIVKLLNFITGISLVSFLLEMGKHMMVNSKQNKNSSINSETQHSS